MKSTVYLYSPYPIASYVNPNEPTCEVAEILEIPYPVPTFNLLWLSMPTLDNLPNGGDRRLHTRAARSQAVGMISVDAAMNHDMFNQLQRHPAKFAEWWAKQDYTRFETHDILGDEWATTVAARAAEAASRISGASVTQQGGGSGAVLVRIWAQPA